MDFTHYFKELYAYCTDFIINLANFTGLSYYEVNFIIFILIYPILLFVTPIIYLIQRRRYKLIKKRTKYIPTPSQNYFRNIKTLSKPKIFISANLALILLSILLTITAAEYDIQQEEYLMQQIRMNPTENIDSDLHASGLGALVTIILSIIFLVLMNLFILLTTYKSNFPVILFTKADYSKIAVILWEMFFVICVATTFLVFILFSWFALYIESMIMMYFIFILMNLRAGQISRYKKRL